MSSGTKAVFHLKVRHGLSTLTSDGAGNDSVSAFLSPDQIPGWSNFGVLFEEFRIKRSNLVIEATEGEDVDGVFSIRVTPSDVDAIEASLSDEVQRGAILHSPAELVADDGLRVNLVPAAENDPDITSNWQSWHATTPFGDAKEYGQVFLFANHVDATSVYGITYIETEISFRTLKNI